MARDPLGIFGDPLGIIKPAQGFVRSVTSGAATEEQFAARKAQCDACPEKVEDEKGEFCGACGCPHSALAELSRKLRFAYVRCPLKRPGFSNAEKPA